MRRDRCWGIALWCILVLAGWPSPAMSQTVDWIQQFGTSSTDYCESVSADGLGNVYVSGYTDGSLGGPSAGARDAFVRKYDAAGVLQWTRQLGTSGRDGSYGVSADGLGNVYISGYTYGDLGGPNAGGDDAFVSKYDAAGTLQWTRQIGTSSADFSGGVSADGLGNVYICGHTAGDLAVPTAGIYDAFVSKYNEAGVLQWTRQFGTSENDFDGGVSADSLGNVYISGDTSGDLGGPNAGDRDAFLSKYDDAGTLQWTRQLGTSDTDSSEGVSVDGLGNIYITGITLGDLGGPNAGSYDAFVSKYNDAGTLQWTRQLGTTSLDWCWSVAADGLGNVYISGDTYVVLDDPETAHEEAFVSKYSETGILQWTRYLGTDVHDWSYGVSADELGNVFMAGCTYGDLGGPSAGGPDAFVARINAVPEPSAVLLALVALACLAARLRPRA